MIGGSVVVHIHAAADGIAARVMRSSWPSDVPQPHILQSDIVPHQVPSKGPPETIDQIDCEGRRIDGDGVVQPAGSVDFSMARTSCFSTGPSALKVEAMTHELREGGIFQLS